MGDEGKEDENAPLTQHQVPSAAADIHEAGIVGTALNMACNIMGGAVLVLPTAMEDASLVPGVILLLCLGLMSCSTMVMLVHSAEKLKVYNYRALLSVTTHPRVGRAFEFALFLYTYGVLVEYGRVISDSMPDVARDFFKAESGVLVQGWFWLVLACIPFAGLTSLPRLTELKWSSFIGFITIVYVQILIIWRYSDGTYRNGRTSWNAPDVEYASLSMNFFRAIPVLSVAFSCHYNVPFYYKELKTRTLRQFYKVLLCVHPALITVYTLCGVLGYLTFGISGLSSTTGNIVNAYRKDDVPVDVGRLGLFFHFCTAFPIVAVGCRNCLNGILFNGPERPQYQYIIESLSLVSTSALLAWLVPGIAFVVDIIGSLFGVAIVFIIPSVVYLQSNRRFADSPPAHAALDVTSTERFFSGNDGAAAARNSMNSGGSAVDDEEASGRKDGEVESLGARLDVPVVQAVRKVPALFILAHVYVVLGFAGAVISFVVTINNVANGNS